MMKWGPQHYSSFNCSINNENQLCKTMMLGAGGIQDVKSTGYFKGVARELNFRA